MAGRARWNPLESLRIVKFSAQINDLKDAEVVISIAPSSCLAGANS